VRMGVDGTGSYSYEIKGCFMSGSLLPCCFMTCDLERWKCLQTFLSTVCPKSETVQFTYTFWKTLLKVISYFTFANFLSYVLSEI
jgi:hypothetical protein